MIPIAEKTEMYVVAIVGIVAVVAILILLLNAGLGDAAVSGQATTAMKTVGKTKSGVESSDTIEQLKPGTNSMEAETDG